MKTFGLPGISAATVFEQQIRRYAPAGSVSPPRAPLFFWRSLGKRVSHSGKNEIGGSIPPLATTFFSLVNGCL